MTHEGIRGVDAGWLEKWLVDLGVDYEECGHCKGHGFFTSISTAFRGERRYVCPRCHGSGVEQ